MYQIGKCEKIILPQGVIYLGLSDKNKSVGYLELNPHTSLTLHNRPTTEKLTQIKGVSNMVIFNDNKGKINILREKDTIDINPLIWHIHTNPYNAVSLTYWDFNGDIVNIIDNIRKTGKK